MNIVANFFRFSTDQSTFDRVTAKIKVALFLWPTVYSVDWLYMYACFFIWRLKMNISHIHVQSESRPFELERLMEVHRFASFIIEAGVTNCRRIWIPRMGDGVVL